MTNREKNFSNYFCLTAYTLKVALFTCDMAMRYCAHSGMKNLLASTKTKINAMIGNLTFSLKPDIRQDILNDLAGDDVMALGVIMQELVEFEQIAEIENDLVKFIRERKQVKEMVHC